MNLFASARLLYKHSLFKYILFFILSIILAFVYFSRQGDSPLIFKIYILLILISLLVFIGTILVLKTLKEKRIDSRQILIKSNRINSNLELQLQAHIKTELELKESETRLKKMIDFSMDAVVVTDSEFNILNWNQKAEIIFDWDEDEVIGKSFIETIIEQRHRTELTKGLNSYLKTQKNTNIINRRIEIKGITSEGDIFPIEVAITPMLVNEQTIFSIFIRDISERMLAEESLRESEGRYQLFTDMAVEAIMISERGKIMDVNPAFTRIFGFKISEVLNQSPMVLLDDTTIETIRHYFESESEMAIELEGIHKNGRRVPLLAQGRNFTYKSRNMRVTAFYDISEVKRAQKEIIYRSNFEKLLSEVSTNFVNVSYKDIDRYISSSIKAVCKFTQLELGYLYLFSDDYSEAVLKNSWLQKGLEINDRSFQTFDSEKFKWWFDLFLKGEPFQIENIETIPDSFTEKSTFVNEEITSILDVPISYQNKIIGFLGVASIGKKRIWSQDEINLVKLLGQVFINALKRKSAEANLQKSYSTLENRVIERTAEIQDKNSQLKDFAYTVSHDLKAPLRGIVGYAQELTNKHQSSMNERAQFCLDQVITATRNLEKLIEDLLSYSRLDTQEQHLTEFSIKDMILNILKDRQATIEEYGTEIELKLKNTRLLGWKLGMNQLLSNLIDNAIKYSRNKEKPHIKITMTKKGDSIKVCIEDNGIGFKEKYKERLFGLFNRLVRSDEFEGTGAGLAICKKVIEKYHGEIDASSVYGEGASFWIIVSLKPKQ